MGRLARALALLVICIIICSTGPALGAVIRVKWDSPNNGPGNDWDHAYQTITAGLAAATSGDEVWVAGDGVHYYNEKITLKDGVGLYGGFAGAEVLRENRDCRANVTVIDCLRAGGPVVTLPAGTTSSTIIDGFTIRGSYGSYGGVYCNQSTGQVINNIITGNGTFGSGGGINCVGASPTITNNTIAQNSSNGNGGGICCNSSSAPIVSNNIIRANSAAYSGGGIYSAGAGTFSNNTIIGNIANTGLGSYYGGGIYSSGSSAKIINNQVAGNILIRYGTSLVVNGGVYCSGSAAVVANNSITSNTGFGLYCSSTPAISNNIVAFNTYGIYGSSGPVLRNNCVYHPGSINYSGISAGATDIQLDPKLASATYGQLHVQSDSPCKDAGCDTIVQADWLDMDGQTRIQGTHVDIGADESDGTTFSFAPAVVRVSTLGSDSNDGSTWALAKRTIQNALDAASARSGEVWVAGGVYQERLTLPSFGYLYGGFAGSETARDERNWNANVTVVDGTQVNSRAASVIKANCALVGCVDGLTIRNGTGTLVSSNGYGGGLYCNSSSPAICNNTITSNYAQLGGGIYCSRASTPTISNNVIAANTAFSGSAIYVDEFASSPIITNNTIVANSASEGGGVHIRYHTHISNNIIAFNSSGLKNENGGLLILSSNCVYNPAGVNYAGMSPGATDIQTDPQLASAAYGNMHIDPESPCRDGGDDAAVQTGWVDLDGQARTQGAHVDIGADESDGTAPGSVASIVRVNPSGSDSNDGSTWALAKRTVQAALDAAGLHGGEVWVGAGTYNELLTLPPFVHLYGGFSGSEITRTHRNPAANVTVLDGGAAGTVVSARGGFRVGAIDGFTIRNAGTTGGYAIYCSASPTISNNVITANANYGLYCSYSYATITGNTISQNGTAGIYAYYSSPEMYGNTVEQNANVGISCYGFGTPVISGNTIRSNTATNGGGISVAYAASPSIFGNTISGNTASGSGGGIYSYQSCPTIRSNTIKSNQAANGGGIYCNDLDPYGTQTNIYSNMIVGNNATSSAGGITAATSLSIANNTIAGNTSGSGGGISCFGDSMHPYGVSISNNLVCFNTAGIYQGEYTTAELFNNCVYNPAGYNYSGLTAGTGDVQLDPLFVAKSTGDYHLRLDSPCVNAGTGTVDAGPIDIDGDPRVLGIAVDMGADETYSLSTVKDSKMLKDYTAIGANGAIVSAAFPDFFYIETADRTCGIRVDKTAHGLSAGMVADIIGTVKTNSNHERYIAAGKAVQIGTARMEPMALTRRALGGGNYFRDIDGEQWGQQGITGARGLNNIGLLVKTCGRVVEMESVSPPALPTWFKIDDGSGVVVKCVVSSGITISPVGTNVAITGVSSCELVGTELHSLLRVRTQSDILPY